MQLAEICHPLTTSTITPAAEAARAALRRQTVALNALTAGKAAFALQGVIDHMKAIHDLLPHGEGIRGTNTGARHQVEALRKELLKSLADINVAA